MCFIASGPPARILKKAAVPFGGAAAFAVSSSRSGIWLLGFAREPIDQDAGLPAEQPIADLNRSRHRTAAVQAPESWQTDPDEFGGLFAAERT